MPTRSKLIFGLVMTILLCRYMLYLAAWPAIATLFSLLRFACVPVAVAVAIRHRPLITKLAILLIISWCILALSTFTHPGSEPIQLLTYAIDISILWLMMRSYMPKYPDDVLRILILIMSAAVVANFVLLLRHPEGIATGLDGKDYFLLGGNYNQFGKTLLPLNTLLAVYCYRTGKMRLWQWAVAGLSVATVLLVGSMTSLLGLIILYAFSLCPSNNLLRLGLIGLFTIYVVFQVVVVFLQVPLDNNALARFLVQDILQKKLTFTERTTLWDNSLREVIISPLIGHGLKHADWYYEHLGGSMPHNLILQTLVEGGILLLTGLTTIIVACYRRYRANLCRTSLLLFAGLMVYLFMMMMEYYALFMIILFVLLVYHNRDFNRETND